MDPIRVLDHGFVRLVDHMGDDMSVVRAARVSYDAEPRGDGRDDKLIRYLMKNGHTSPFEMVEFTFEVKAPVFVIRQWHRHRTWSYNEVSARYTELPEEFYVPEPGVIGVQSKSSKQARDIDGGASVESSISSRLIEAANTESFRAYRALLKAGVPRELARSVLPMSTYTRMFAKVDLSNLFRFLRERLHPHAQWEIRQYADVLLRIARQVAPVSTEVFEESL